MDFCLCHFWDHDRKSHWYERPWNQQRHDNGEYLPSTAPAVQVHIASCARVALPNWHSDRMQVTQGSHDAYVSIKASIPQALLSAESVRPQMCVSSWRKALDCRQSKLEDMIDGCYRGTTYKDDHNFIISYFFWPYWLSQMGLLANTYCCTTLLWN